MKKLRNLVALLAIFSMATVFTGCGDDDDDDDNNNNNPPAGPQFAPGTEAGFIGNTYNISLADGTTAQLTFPNNGSYSLTSNGQTETGTITGLTRNGEDYVATLTPANTDGSLRAGELRVHFTQKTANTYTGTITSQGANGTETLPFTATVNTGGTNGSTDGGTDGSTDGGTDGTTDGGTDGSTDGGTTGTATEPPASLVGKTLQLTYGDIGGERFDFNSGNTAIYEQGNQVLTYTWDLANTRIQGTRRDANANVVADYDIDLTFNQGSGNAGTASVIYTEPNATPRTDPATFTLLP